VQPRWLVLWSAELGAFFCAASLHCKPPRVVLVILKPLIDVTLWWSSNLHKALFMLVVIRSEFCDEYQTRPKNFMPIVINPISR
jgi:hypothetical protein